MSLAAAGRLSLRLAGRRRWTAATAVAAAGARGLACTARRAVAQNMTMPALSPTMTEGSIAAWRVKEGDRYAAGDVLLEIETDKATMDVEAQEDGAVFRILQADGSKGVAVGTRIAVLAEPDDDLGALAMPPDETGAADRPAAAETTTATAATTTATAATTTDSPAAKPAQPQHYPLFPSVAQLIKQSGLDPAAVVGDMTPTGPGGRLLKGDVLAYLGRVAPDVPAALEARFETLAHLDLRNIKIKAAAAPQVDKPAQDKPAPAPAQAQPAPSTAVSLPVSLAAVLDAQDKIQASLGVFMPVSTFVARATDVANDALPRAGPPPPPTAAELFDALVAPGRSAARPPSSSSSSARVTRGHYRPQIAALPTAGRPAAKRTPRAADVVDILTGKAKATTPAARRPQQPPPPPAVSTGLNYFTVSVPKAEEKRAQVFLERLKVVLENEPGRLVL